MRIKLSGKTTQGNELLLRAVANAAVRILEINGASKEELGDVKYCFCDCEHCTRLEYIAHTNPEQKVISLSRKGFYERLGQPFGLYRLIYDLIHDFLYILHPVSDEEYTKRSSQIEKEIDREAEEYLRKGLAQISASWSPLDPEEERESILSKQQTTANQRKMTKEDYSNIFDEFCTCGHLKSEHEQGHEKCSKSGCDCVWYTWDLTYLLKDGTRAGFSARALDISAIRTG